MNNIINYQLDNQNNNEMNNFNIDKLNRKYKYIDFLGNTDSNSTVHIIKNKDTRKKMLCKIIDLNQITNKNMFKKTLENEIKLYKFLNTKLYHKDIIIPFLYKEKINNNLYLFSKYKKMNSLKVFEENINKKNVCSLIKNIIFALNKLHHSNIIHENLNEGNIHIIPKHNKFKILFTNISSNNIKKHNLFEELKKKDINDLGYIFNRLLDKFIEDSFFSKLFNYDKNIVNYNKIINNYMNDNIQNTDFILKSLIHYDKYNN
jgi:serine/threonine protein kinase